MFITSPASLLRYMFEIKMHGHRIHYTNSIDTSIAAGTMRLH